MNDNKYYYGMKLRGFSPGAQPKEGLIDRINDPSDRYWDIIIYDRLLSNEELYNYDLEYIATK